MEGRHEHSPVGHEEVEVLIEMIILGMCRLRTGARRGSGEAVLRTGAKLADRPRHVVLLESGDHTFGEACRERDHVLEGGVGEITQTSGATPRDAMLSVLRPDQRQAYEEEQKHRVEEARKDMEAIGLTLPPDWEMLDQDGF